MRTKITQQTEMFSYIPIESRVPKKHPLRKIRVIVDNVLEKMDKDFDEVYSTTGRPSIPPEMILKSLFLQVLYSIRSEGQMLEHLEYNLLYRWFVGLTPDDRLWDETVFSKNRERILTGKIIERFFREAIAMAEDQGLVSDEHFTVDGTLVEAWASLKSLEKIAGDDIRKDDGDKGNPSVDFRNEKRSNETHQSRTDPESKIYTKSKGQTARLTYMGHVLMENRNGLAVEADVTQSGYFAEHDAAITMLKKKGSKKRRTLGADKHYDNDKFCDNLKKMKVTPHVAMNIHARKFNSAIDKRTTRHEGYAISQKKRKRVEEIFGWLKVFANMRRPHVRGKKKIEGQFLFSVSVYNILRIRNLTEVMA